MKTLLINPPWYCFQSRESHYVPLGLVYVAGALTTSGYEVKILNGEEVLGPHTLDESTETPVAFFHATDRYVQFHDLSLPIWQVLGEAIARHAADVVGITMWSGAYQSAINTCKLVKTLNPGAITVVGGIHPTLDPLSVIQHSEVDFVVCGEGERAAVELWRLLEEGGDVHKKAARLRGIWTRVNGKVHEGGKTETIEDLDEIPFPNYEVVVGEPARAVLGLMTARGCPYGCTFCASKEIWGRKVRFRSIESCMDELAHYREKFGLKWFRVNDDSFCLHRVRVLEFCDLLVARFGHTWSFAIDANVDTLDEEIIDKLVWAGCTGISIGVESVVPRIQKLCHKYVDLERARRMIAYINQSKIGCGVYFMTGFPHETEEELKQNIRFMEDTRPQNAMWSIVTPYPGTDLHRYAIQEGILPDTSPIHLMHHSIKTSMADIPPERYEELLWRILRIRDRIARKHRLRRDWYGFRPVLSRLARAGRVFGDHFVKRTVAT
jgi:radical SAM superfamily enzyme YgiQ (UPF0313 family)